MVEAHVLVVHALEEYKLQHSELEAMVKAMLAETDALNKRVACSEEL